MQSMKPSANETGERPQQREPCGLQVKTSKERNSKLAFSAVQRRKHKHNANTVQVQLGPPIWAGGVFQHVFGVISHSSNLEDTCEDVTSMSPAAN